MCDFLDCKKWKELDCSQFNADIFRKPTCYRPPTEKPETGAKLAFNGLLEALRPFAEAYGKTQVIVKDTEFQNFLDNDQITPNMIMGDFRKASEAYWKSKGL